MGGEGAERALRRLRRAEAAFDRSQARVAGLRMKLSKAEDKMARRAARVGAAGGTLVAAAGAPSPAESATEVAADGGDR